MIRHMGSIAEIVDDLEASVRFYREALGLAVEQEIVPWASRSDSRSNRWPRGRPALGKPPHASCSRIISSRGVSAHVASFPRAAGLSVGNAAISGGIH